MKQPTFAVRPAQLSDLQSLCGLRAGLMALHAEKAPRYYRQPGGPEALAESFRRPMHEAGKALLVAEADGVLAGYAHLETREDPAVPELVPRRWANVVEMAVDPSLRRQGAGRQLMERARDWARGQGCSELRLSVLEFNQSARDFYLRQGYGVRNHIMALPLA
jgi:GNAT superfamily N-acetyltransferase